MEHKRRMFALCLRLACAVAALTAAFACDEHTPTAPSPVTALPPLRADESGGALLGSIDLVPASGLSQFATIPQNKWALVRVSGKWIVKPNPACADQPPTWPCSSLAAYSGFDPDYPDAFAGPVRVRAVSSLTGSTDALELRGIGGQDEAIGLTQREFPRSVEANPALINPTVQQFGNTGPTIPSYIFEGSYTVTVTEIASPIRVTEGAAEADGTRTYTVEPLYGLQLLNPFGSSDPPGAVRWYFVPGDSVDPVATNSDPPWRIDECRNQISCTWQPPGPGRVQVSAFVETRRARARNADATAGDQTPRLEVRCSPTTVHRGEGVVCEAFARPRGLLTVTKWRFDDDLGHIIRPSDPQQDSADVWGGRMVVSGTVHVEGKIDGRAVPSDSAHISVEPRTPWSLTYPAEPAPAFDRGDSLPYPPVARFGERIGNGVLGRFYGGAMEWVIGRGTGPNEGMTFVRDVPRWTLPLLILINAGLDSSDPWYKAQVGATSSRPHGCGTPFVSREAVNTPRHESGHYRIARRFWLEPSTSAALESAIGYDTGGVSINARVDSLDGVLGRLQASFDSADAATQDCDPYPLPRR